MRVGIVGAGLMGRWHADAARRSGGRVAAIMDPDLERAGRLSSRYPNARGFSDVETMIQQVDLDVLHICSPASTHHEIAGVAIDAGLHLLIEKPITPTAEDAVRLLGRAAERGVLVCPVHQFIFQDGVLKAKTLLPRIGRLVHIDATICSAGGAGLTSEQLDLIVSDVLPHALSLMQIFLSHDLSAERWLTIRPAAGELRFSGEVSGVTFSSFISMNARPTTNTFRILGTKGTIDLNLFHGYAFMQPGQVSRNKKIIHPFEFSLRNLSAALINLGQRAMRREPAYPGLRRLVNSFYQAVRTGSQPPISPEDTILIARVRDQIIQTAGLLVPQQEYVGA
ncbi:MAG: Gfo/Idh/MocA family oxidoreductase [Pyrinomonadaceae bacterium]|nr:Gfo/Idh/MocA family oxidoreductase [Pyrinomonadaceae bacterium]